MMEEETDSKPIRPSRPLPPAAGEGVVIGMLILAVFFSMGARAIFSPLMPSVQSELGLSLSTAGSLFLIVSISYSLAMLLCGFLAALIGHGLTIVASLMTIAAGLLLTSFAQGFLPLAAGMACIGAGAGIYPPSGVVMINTKISMEKRATAFSLHEIGPNLSLLMAPLLVLLFEPWLGWRGVLFWMAAVCILAALVFWRIAAAGSGFGAPPKLGTLGTILRIRSIYIGMAILSAILAGLHGVYAILPAYLVSEHGLDSRYVITLLMISRIAGVLLLLRTGWLIDRLGARRTIAFVVLFSAFFTACIGFIQGPLVSLVVVLQPALLAATTPALLAAVAAIGEVRYQNLTYALIITVGVGVGSGVAPALLGVFSDFGLSWLGFLALACAMAGAVGLMLRTPEFGRRA